jgi:TonB family protein
MALSTQASAHGADAPERPEPSVPVLVVTTDDELWVRLSAALPGLRLQQYDSVADLSDGWAASRPAAVLLDPAAEADVARAAEALQTHSVSLVPVAIVDAATRPAIVALERSGALFAHVERTLPPGATLAALERAAEEAQARAVLVPPGVTHAVAPGPRTARVHAHRTQSTWLLGAAVAALIATGAAAWWYSRADRAPAAAAPTSANPVPTEPDAAGRSTVATPPAEQAVAAAPTPDAAAERVETLLAAARAAMRDRRYIDPESDNALAHYRGVLAVDAANGEARQGVERILDLLVARAESSMNAREYPAALRALEAARSLRPDHPRLAALDAQVAQRLAELSLTQIQAALQADAFERATVLMRQAERSGAVPPATLAQLRQEMARREARRDQNELVRVVQARIAQGRLLEPAGDSAKHHLAQLQQRGDSADALARLRQEYARRLAAEARAAIGRGDVGAVEPWLAELRTAAPALVPPVQRELAQAQQRAAAAQAEREAQAQQAMAARESAAADAASAAPSPAARAVAATPPRPLRALQLQYPPRALQQGLTGWVDVEFVVDPSGRAQDVRTTGAEPAGVFEQAAIAAVRRTRFEPARTADGATVAMSSRMRVRFALQN